MKNKTYAALFAAIITCLTGCSSNYETMDARQISHEMQDHHFGGKNVQFDAIVSLISGDGISMTSLDGQVMVGGRIQRKVRATVDTLKTGDKIHVTGYIHNEGEQGVFRNVLTIESIAKIGG